MNNFFRAVTKKNASTYYIPENNEANAWLRWYLSENVVFIVVSH